MIPINNNTTDELIISKLQLNLKIDSMANLEDSLKGLLTLKNNSISTSMLNSDK